MNWKVLVFIALIYSAYQAWQKRPVEHGAGIVAAHTPQQSNAKDTRIHHINGYQIKPLSSFSIQARVLAKEHYNFGREADLSPLDLALGWGPMSDEAVLSQITISQSNRFYFWHVKEFPIPRRLIEINSANMHMVPADDAVKETLESVRVGQVVHIEGYLIEAESADGWRWKSSLTREDTGAGACELVLVKRIHIS